MKTVLHKSNTRNSADFGWLKVNHTFSFADYYNPKRMNFGKLRVLNDDIIKPHTGFGEHPHENMEIVTIPLTGTLTHKDNTGGSGKINTGDIQVMSAGSGIRHSEYNHESVPANVLQTWVFPKQKNVSPRYDQKTFTPDERKNGFQLIVSPDGRNGSLFVHQDVFYSLGNFEANSSERYTIQNPENGVYIFVIEGSVNVADTVLNKRDGLGVWATETLNFTFLEQSEVLLIDVPMH